MSRTLKVFAIVGLAASVAACGTVRNVWPFNRDQAAAVASAGERISIIGLDQTVTPTPSLAGRDFFLPAPRAVTSWPLPGGNTDQVLEHVAGGENMQIAWRRNIGQGASRTTQVTSPVVASDGRIYVMDGESTVVAVDAQSGAILWRQNIRPQTRDRNSFGGGLAVAGDRVYASSGYRVTVALDAASGAIVWSSPNDSPVRGAPTVAGDRVYVVDIDNQILAYNRADGSLAWSYQAIAEPARIMRASSPAVTGDTVIAPFSSGELVALRASNGSQLWTQVLSRTSRTNALSELRDISGRPAVFRGSVYAISHSGVMAAMDVRTGAPTWSLPLAGTSAPWVAGDVVYAVSTAGELVTVNRANGQVYWVRNLNEGRERRRGGFLGVGARTERPVWTGPILASNRLLLVNSRGQMISLDPKTGVENGALNLGAPAYIAPIAYNGALYVLTDNGQLISIR
ncbi:MAG: PQQ-binding-like beta-propeller repeat protein [Brevundimonas sp.]|jgi:outer membrane protein assembly factor BamB|uniref:PQQ-binding-like beta-propeller repeat protein n=1 Tax=Brevundimonas sp. TaxID=1871086 RepID=UPI00391D6E6A